MTNYHKLRGLHRNILPLNSGGWKSEVEMRQGWVPSEAVREGLFMPLSV